MQQRVATDPYQLVMVPNARFFVVSLCVYALRQTHPGQCYQLVLMVLLFLFIPSRRSSSFRGGSFAKLLSLFVLLFAQAKRGKHANERPDTNLLDLETGEHTVLEHS